ncbi:VOC family protein [Amycolatopsis pithecellobii]|uniref:VOC family protein n=1 Tax=Amycolatopsis pithecellobii TaxID=664692 RepID=UPI001AA07407|nr:VOC family protein [Amycolatopsis pithecellobii]
MEKTGYDPGTPCWVDLTTPDIDGAARFYSELFGWEVIDQGSEYGGYRMCQLRGKPVAGMGPQQQPGMPPTWTSYVAVADANVTTKAVTAAGGQVYVEPMEVPGTGTMAIYADPGGAVFGGWQPGPFTGAALVNEPGTLSWNELVTRHPDAAADFYHAVFGWSANRQPMDGIEYTTWQLGDSPIAGMLPMDERWPAEAPPFWVIYFAVSGTDDIVASATRLGGTVMQEPTDVPVGRFAVVTDPAGAAFGVITLNRE